MNTVFDFSDFSYMELAVAVVTCTRVRSKFSSASAVLRCRTKTGVDAAGMSAQQSMNRTARSPDGS